MSHRTSLPLPTRSAHVTRKLTLLSFGIAIGCGSGAPTIPDELLDCCDGSGGQGGGGSSDYPPGPYGTEIGSTLENFTFEGYRNPQESRTRELVSFSDFYDPDGEQGYELLLLNTAAAWCQPCIIEHRDLPSRAERHEEDGLVIVSMLFQNEDGSPADLETLDAWVRTFDTNFPMLLDPAYQMGRYGPSDTPPLNLIVDPRDMTLLARFVGNQEGPMWAFIESELAARSEP